MTDQARWEEAPHPMPGERVRLRLALGRPRSLDGQTGVLRCFWPYVADGHPWLVALDQPVLDGGRSWSMVRCALGELEAAPELPPVLDVHPSRLGSLRMTLRFLRSRRRETRALSESQSIEGSKPARRIESSGPWFHGAPEVIDYRERVEFVGRQKQLADFVENLALPLDDDRRRFVYDISGPSGVGKTWLLRRYRSLFQKAGGIAIWVDDSDDDVVDLMEQIAAQVATHGRSLATFDDGLRHYRQADRAVSECPERMLVDGGERAHHAVQALTPLMLEGLRAAVAARPIGLFIDGHERSSGYLDHWIQDILEGHYGELADSTVIAIAGPNALQGSRWRRFEPVIGRVPLAAFSEAETRTFLAHHWIRDERVVRTIQQVSGQLPVLVATTTARASDHLERLTDPDRGALDCLLASFGDPSRRSTALDAALPRYLDVDVLDRLLAGQNSRTAIKWLRQMPFVEQRGGAWTYRRVVRDTLLRHVRQESPARWARLHDRLADYYERLRDSVLGEPLSRLTEATGRAYEIEALYHRLCQNPPDYLADALDGFVAVFGDHPALARHWAEMVRQAGYDANDSTTRYWGERLLEAASAELTGDYRRAAATFGALLETPELDERWRPKTLVWESRLISAASRLNRTREARTTAALVPV